MTHRTSIYYCNNCGKIGHGQEVGWMEATEESKGVNIVVSGPLKFVAESDVTVTAYEERDANEVLDDEFLASVHSYHVETGGDVDG